MHQFYDKGYKRLLKNRRIFRELIETFVTEAWVKELDFETCETLDKSFISDHYKEFLLKVKNVVSLLFLAEAHYDAELLEKVFLEVFEKETDKGPISLLLNWLIQMSKHGRIPEEDVDKLERIYESKEEVQQMLTTALKKERQDSIHRRAEIFCAYLIF
jgi:hypothetical protein